MCWGLVGWSSGLPSGVAVDGDGHGVVLCVCRVGQVCVRGVASPPVGVVSTGIRLCVVGEKVRCGVATRMRGGDAATSHECVTVVSSGRGLVVGADDGKVEGLVAWCAGVRGDGCRAARPVLVELLSAGHGDVGRVDGAR